jgi:REP element-mobilizing transposase RayT
MSRPLRIEYPDAWYHVMNRGRRREEVFRGRQDYARFLEVLKETATLYKLRVAAYCLMPNHYHLLVQTPEANLSRCLRHIDGVYTQRFNRFHGTDGPLFRGRYKAILVEKDSYLLPLVRYIHHNPARAGVTRKWESYEWSSHRHYISGIEKENWIYKGFILSLFPGAKEDRIKAYRRYAALEDDKNVVKVLENKKWPSILGSEKFIRWIRERFFSDKLNDEVPQSKELAPGPDLILKTVESFYGIERKEFLRSRRGVLNEPRNVAIYLLRRLRGDSLKQIGENFRMNKYSSVSSVIERVKREMAEDRKLQGRIKKLIVQLEKSQEQT